MADAIRAMVVRGAPAIGIAGAMGVALAARRAAGDDLDAVKAEVARAAADPARGAADGGQPRLRGRPPGRPGGRRIPGRRRRWPPTSPRPRGRCTHDEVERCERMGRHALALLSRGARILTHCNAGALATGGYGTALGVVRAAFAADPTVRVVVDETRPLLQGARLTAWELEREGIPYTLIADAHGGGDDGARAASPTPWWGPTASPPTATWSTRSAPTAWRSWPASTASR